MHVLTKIFIVLVSLLAVFLVPLVVVYTHNENSYKNLYQQAQADVMVERARAATERATRTARDNEFDRQIEELRTERSRLVSERNEALVDIQRLEARVATAEAGRAQIQSELAKLASGVQAGTALTGTLVEELRTLRRDAMVGERQRVEIDEQLRDVMSQLEVAVAARRALQEELQRMTEQQSQTLSRLSEYVVRYGTLSDQPAAMGIIPDRNVTASVLAVRRGGGQVLAEISAGSRDGVKEGWTMVIGRGSEFVANLRIVSVDLNRATGIVTLEDRKRGLVNVGDTVQSYAGMD